MWFSCSSCLNVVLIYFFVNIEFCLSADIVPCYGCKLFSNTNNGQELQRKRAITQMCPRNCPNCPFLQPCNDGVSRVLDGCQCCFMCARQHGDLCSVKEVCDKSKDLFCDIPRGQIYGICRAAAAKPCKVGSAVYEDGKQFKLDCKQLCTCQNGRYGCVNLCPQEHRPPDKSHCPNARLTQVRGQCCQEWTCEESYDALETFKRHGNKIQSANLVSNKNYPNDAVVSKHYRRNSNEVGCSKESTKWSQCSVTCGVGVSLRLSPKDCQKQTRLCYIRPCGFEIPKNVKCNPTTRSFERRKIVYNNCESVRAYRMKFCTTCRKNRCCYPKKQKTRSIEFVCDGGRQEFLKYAWIKRCKCSRNCYKRKSNAIEYP